MRRVDGTLEVLNSTQGVILGVVVTQRSENETTFGIGDLLLMYTDGLVQYRPHTLSTAIISSAEHLAAADADDLSRIARRLVDATPRIDDAAAFVIVRASQATP